MFDKYMICEDSVHNLERDGETVGFALQARLPYYRGLGLSMVEEIGLEIDGQAIPREAIRFSVRGKSWTLDEMEVEYTERWNFGEKADIHVLQPGGLKAGPHQVKLSERLRISYLPFVPTTKDEKTIVI
jgi:hypothetical protein